MSKTKKSKLDLFAARLDEWFGVEKKTIAEVQAQLGLDGCVVSSGRLSQWWSARQQERMREKLLADIASGSRLHQEVKLQFGRNPAPELQTLINLHQRLIFQLAAQGGEATPEMLDLVSSLMKPVLEFAKLNLKEREFSLAKDKFEFDAAKACLEKLPQLKAVSDALKMSPDEKAKAIQQILFPK